jgi:phosphonate transport system substrate-binding protein
VTRGFCLGTVPAGGGTDRAEALTGALSQALGRAVSLHQASDYRGLVGALEQGLIQLAWVPPIAAMDALRNDTIKPLAVALRSGMASYASALFSRAGGPIKAVADLRGVRAAWVDRQSAGGYVYVRAALRKQGHSLVDAFREELFLRSHEEVARAVLDGRADVGASYLSYHSGTLEIAHAGWRRVAPDQAFHPVIAAGPIPSDLFAVHSGVDPADAAALQSAIVDARPALAHRLAKELTGADGFGRPTVEHLALLRGIAEALGPPSSRRTR